MFGDNIYTELDELYLIELYEFASQSTTIQPDFKLILAWWLTVLGFTEESKAYCDSITDAINNNNGSLESLKQLGDTANER